MTNYSAGEVVKPELDEDRVPDVYRLKFFINVSNSDIISKAELRLLKRPTNVPTNQPLTYISERVEVRLISQPHDFVESITSQQVLSDTEGYVVFNILDVIKEWMEFDTTNLAREMELKIKIGFLEHEPRIEFVFDNETRHSQVVVATAFRDQPSSRQKRENDYEFCDSRARAVQSCCVKRFVINFEEDFGWSWLVYPKALHVNYCEGVCPLALLNNHRAVLGAPNFRNPTSSPDPCCVGSDFHDTAVMLIVNGTYIIETLQGVRVEACSCR